MASKGIGLATNFSVDLRDSLFVAAILFAWGGDGGDMRVVVWGWWWWYEGGDMRVVAVVVVWGGDGEDGYANK